MGAIRSSSKRACSPRASAQRHDSRTDGRLDVHHATIDWLWNLAHQICLQAISSSDNLDHQHGGRDAVRERTDRQTDRQTVRQTALAGTTLILVVTSVIAGCDPPTPPGCFKDNGSGQLECETGTTPACLNFCVARGEQGDPCVHNPCDAVTETICSVGLTCVDGECRPTAADLLLGCDPTIFSGQDGACAQNTFCAGLADCEEYEVPSYLPPETPGICLHPAKEGEPCDGNWDDVTGGGLCQPCEPGTFCEDSPWGGPRICQRGCSADEHCPCVILEAGEPSCVDGLCRVCLADRVRCDPEAEGPPCCDPQAECRGVMFQDGEMSVTVHTCCTAIGDDCEMGSDCCPNATCNGGICQSCGYFPGAPPGEAGCCPPLVLHTEAGMEPVCGLPCEAAAAERVCREDGGVCGGAQKWLCDPVLGDRCPGPDEENPEGDDCLVMDHDVCGMWPGKYACNEEGELMCEPNPSCPAAGSTECGQPGHPTCDQAPVGTWECLEDDNCEPGYFCKKTMYMGEEAGAQCALCNNDPPRPACWRPIEDRGGCVNVPSCP